MGEVTSYAPGVPAWVDLATSDPEGARRFYGELFGWEFDIGPAETMHYTQCQLRGKNVAGMGGDPAPEGMPTAWTTYLASDDVAAAAERIRASGGTIMMEPLEVMGFGNMLVAADPTGAAFGLWQGISHIGASLIEEPGTVTWNELSTRDLERAKRFYSEVLGYIWEPLDLGEQGPPYATFNVGDKQAGGALEMNEQWPADTPPHWMVYFAVEDCDATAEQARKLGGSVPSPPTDSPYGRFALLSDPQGATFTVIKPPPASEG